MTGCAASGRIAGRMNLPVGADMAGEPVCYVRPHRSHPTCGKRRDPRRPARSQPAMRPASQRAPMPGVAFLFRSEPANEGAVAARSWKASRNARSAGLRQPPFRQPSARPRRTENRPAANRTDLLAGHSHGFIVADHVAATIAPELQLGLDAPAEAKTSTLRYAASTIWSNCRLSTTPLLTSTV